MEPVPCIYDPLMMTCHALGLVLECREGNTAAIGFYRRIGYAVCEKYPPYGDEKDAVCMEKPLLCDTERRKEKQNT